MASTTGPQGAVFTVDAAGQPLHSRVHRNRGLVYLSLDGLDHLLHPSNWRRANGIAIEATLVFHVSDAVYPPL